MTTQTIWERGKSQAGTLPAIVAPPVNGTDRRPLVYGALVVFAWL